MIACFWASPIFYCSYFKSPLQIIIAGPEKEAKPLIDAVNTLLLPQKILIRAPDEQSQKTSLLYQKLNVLKDIPTKQAKAYVCRNYACSQPVETPEALIKLIQEQWHITRKEDIYLFNIPSNVFGHLLPFLGPKYVHKLEVLSKKSK